MSELISQKKIINLCQKIQKKKNNDKCYFFEVGANDGITQSNTYEIEKKLNWTGILVEPIPSSFQKLKKNRKNCEIFNFFLSDHENQNKIEMKYNFSFGNLMASVHKKSIFNFFKHKTIKVNSTTFNQVMEMSKAKQVDFLSLDVEGHELKIIKSINFEKYRPYAIIVEIWKNDCFEIIDYLSKNNYFPAQNASNFTMKNNPKWSQNHQDFIFIHYDFAKYFYDNNY